MFYNTLKLKVETWIDTCSRITSLTCHFQAHVMVVTNFTCHFQVYVIVVTMSHVPLSTCDGFTYIIGPSKCLRWN